MARQLNRQRILITQAGLVSVLLASLFTQPLMHDGLAIHHVLDIIGSALVMVCAIGRVYSTAFLGGHKNAELITYGPFSIVRNPLYMFSFIGVCGVVLISCHLVFILTIPALFAWTYLALIKREEAFLLEHFGEAYRTYMQTTPRLLPKFRLYQAPETVPMCPRFMLKALRDCTLWLLIFPMFELIEKLQESGIVQMYFLLP
jgi:protein-S-isoprenylcysteine O-methyltransferase Ste14